MLWSLWAKDVGAATNSIAIVKIWGKAMRRKICSIAAAAMLALEIIAAGVQQPNAVQGAEANNKWRAVAPGLVESRSGEIKVMAPVIGIVSQVLVQAGDKVIADEPLIRLYDEQARARIATSQAQVEMRHRARNDQGANKAADRRRAEDAVADAEAALVQALESFDTAVDAKHGGHGPDADIAAARATWRVVQDRLAQRRMQLRELENNPKTALPTANEGQLNIARGELRTAYAGLEQLTIRAPIASTVLQVNPKPGELASPSAPQALVLLGDLSGLRVRAEIDERDVSKVKIGGAVVVRSEAFRDREFAGKVMSISPMVQSPRINSPGSGNLTDFGVADVLIELADPGPLLVGMKVDVYFQIETASK
jgi:HlyD family secretion protein